jgi:hypothetical protein
MKVCTMFYDGHWCDVCGVCTCTTTERPRRWASPGDNPECQVHGVESSHGHLILAGRFRISFPGTKISATE